MNLLDYFLLLCAFTHLHDRCLVTAMKKRRRLTDDMEDEEEEEYLDYVEAKPVRPNGGEIGKLVNMTVHDLNELKDLMMKKRSLLIENIAESYTIVGKSCHTVYLDVTAYLSGYVLHASMEPLMSEIIQGAETFYDNVPKIEVYEAGKRNRHITGMTKDDFIELHKRHINEGAGHLATLCQNEFIYWNSTIESYEVQNEGVDRHGARHKRLVPLAPAIMFGLQALPTVLPPIITVAKFALTLAVSYLGFKSITSYFGWGISTKTLDEKAADVNEMYEHVEEALLDMHTLQQYMSNIKLIVRDTNQILFDRFKDVLSDLFTKRGVSRHFFHDDQAIRTVLKSMLGDDFYTNTIYSRQPRQALSVMEAHLFGFEADKGFRVQLCIPVIDNHVQTRPLVALQPLGYYDETKEKYQYPLLPAYMQLPYLDPKNPITMTTVIQESRAVDISKCTFIGTSAICLEFEPMMPDCNLGRDNGCNIIEADWTGLLQVRRFGAYTIIAQNICSHSTITYEQRDSDGKTEDNRRLWKQSDARIFAIRMGEEDRLVICDREIVGVGATNTVPEFRIAHYDAEWMKAEMEGIELLVKKIKPHILSMFDSVKRINDTITTGSRWAISGTLIAAFLLACYFFFRRNHIGDDVSSLIKITKTLWGGYTNIVDTVRAEKKKSKKISRKIVNGERIKDLPNGDSHFETDTEPTEDQRLRRRVKRKLKEGYANARHVANSVTRQITDGYETVMSIKTDTEDERRKGVRDLFRGINSRSTSMAEQLWGALGSRVKQRGRGMRGSISSEFLINAAHSVANMIPSHWAPSSSSTAGTTHQCAKASLVRHHQAAYPTVSDLNPTVDIPLQQLKQGVQPQKMAANQQTKDRKKPKKTAKLSSRNEVREHDGQEHHKKQPTEVNYMRRNMCDTPLIPDNISQNYIDDDDKEEKYKDDDKEAKPKE